MKQILRSQLQYLRIHNISPILRGAGTEKIALENQPTAPSVRTFDQLERITVPSVTGVSFEWIITVCSPFPRS